MEISKRQWKNEISNIMRWTLFRKLLPTTLLFLGVFSWFFPSSVAFVSHSIWILPHQLENERKGTDERNKGKSYLSNAATRSYFEWRTEKWKLWCFWIECIFSATGQHSQCHHFHPIHRSFNAFCVCVCVIEYCRNGRFALEFFSCSLQVVWLRLERKTSTICAMAIHF